MSFRFLSSIEDRIMLAVETVGAVERQPPTLEVDDPGAGPPAPNLRRLARLVGTAQRGVLDCIHINGSLGGSGHAWRHGAVAGIALATRLAHLSKGIMLVPTVHSSRIEPGRLVEAMVDWEGYTTLMAWQLEMPEAPVASTHAPDILAAVVEDVWGTSAPVTKLAVVARAKRARRATRAHPNGHRPGETVLPPGGTRLEPMLVMRGQSSQDRLLSARRANIVRITASNPAEAWATCHDIRAAAAADGRDPKELRITLDLTVALSPNRDHACARAELAEDITGRRLGGDGLRFIGTPDDLATQMLEWHHEGVADGFTICPTSVPHDLMMVVDHVVPVLQDRGLYPRQYSTNGPTPLPMPAGYLPWGHGSGAGGGGVAGQTGVASQTEPAMPPGSQASPAQATAYDTTWLPALTDLT